MNIDSLAGENFPRDGSLYLIIPNIFERHMKTREKRAGKRISV
jgi:hypothetical protein